MDYDAANPPLLQPNAPLPAKGFVVTTLLIVKDVARSRRFYEHVFGAQVIVDDEPSVLRFANTWLIINRGGGPTDDKPTVTAAPPADLDRLGIAMNIRVADIRACYDLWRSRGAQFITEPKVHKYEIRCYIRAPDGYLIEVGQTTSYYRKTDGSKASGSAAQASQPPVRARRSYVAGTRHIQDCSTISSAGITSRALQLHSSARRRPRAEEICYEASRTKEDR